MLPSIDGQRCVPAEETSSMEARTAKIREPVKGAGVPKETPEVNNLDVLLAAVGPFLSGNSAAVKAEIIRSGYFDASMQRQLNIAAEVLLVNMQVSARAVDGLIDALGASTVERVRGVAPAVAMSHFGKRPAQCLQRIRRAGCFAGAWPQEQAQGFVHQLTIDLGFERIYPLVAEWVVDPDPLVRRLVVEGLRPRGVMTPHITELRADPGKLRPMLEAVLDDHSDYVRKAAANNINDISRDAPDLVCRWVTEWLRGNPSPERRWIMSRGLRTLVKAGNPTAMKLAGLGNPTTLELRAIASIPQQVTINQLIPIAVTLHNAGKGTMTARVQVKMVGPSKTPAKLRKKIYLIQSISIPAGGEVVAKKTLHFTHSNAQPHLPGSYTLEFIANGRTLGERSFRFRG